MPTRRRARTIAFQILYSMVYNPVDIDEAARRYFVLEKERKKALPPFALDLARVARHNQEAIDARINAHLQHWRPERLTLPDRLLLRLACAEFYHFNEIPPKVTLDEYIDLAREFSDDAAPAFVNGVLDAVLKAEPLPEGKALDVAPRRPRHGHRGGHRKPKEETPEGGAAAIETAGTTGTAGEEKAGGEANTGTEGGENTRTGGKAATPPEESGG